MNTSPAIDLLDYPGDELYYDSDPPGEETERLLHQTSEHYGEAIAEHALMRAYFLEPENLSVLVALYRYLFYRQRLGEAMMVAERLLQIAARRLGVDADWRILTQGGLGIAVQTSINLTRFYLSALKGLGYLRLRMGDPEAALECLRKVNELDSQSRIGVAPLIEIAEQAIEEGRFSPAA